MDSTNSPPPPDESQANARREVLSNNQATSPLAHLAELVIFLGCLFVGVLGQGLGFGLIAAGIGLPEPLAGFLGMPFFWSLTYLALRKLAINRRRARESDTQVNRLAEAALFGFALSSLLLGLCAGMMLRPL